MMKSLSAWAFLCLFSLTLSDDRTLSSERQALLKQHNDFRRKHNARALEEDFGLNNAAQQYAEFLARTGKFEHSKNRVNVGENLWRGTAGYPTLGAGQSWYNEVSIYRRNPGRFNSQVGHFTAMVWKGTTKVGFGVATARGKKLVVARYSPPGNVPGRYNENVDLGNGGGMCCEVVNVSGKGDAFDTYPSIFTTYTLESNLVNGKGHYTSKDGTKAIAYIEEKGIWIIQKEERRGASIGWAYTDEDPECPAKTGNTWKYTDGSWKEAKDGLKVQCKNLKP